MDKAKRRKSKFKVVGGRISTRKAADFRLLLLLLLFVFGVVCGALCIKRGEDGFVEKIAVLIDSYRLVRSSQPFLVNCCNSLLVNVLIQLCAVVCGFSALGMPLIMFLPFVKGLALGAVSGFFYSTYALTGIGYCFVVLFPGNVISAMSLFFSCNESCALSKSVFRRIFSNGEKAENIKIFMFRQLFYLGITLVSALLDALLYSSFASFFSL